MAVTCYSVCVWIRDSLHSLAYSVSVTCTKVLIWIKDNRETFRKYHWISGGRNVQVQNVSWETTGPKCQWVKRPGPKCQGAKRPVQKVRGETSWSKTPESEKSGCENTSWAFISWLWNFLYDCDTPWGFFMIVRFFCYYHLNLIYDSLIGLT